MSEGWIKLSRSIADHWLWRDPVKLKWWLDLLIMAKWKDSKEIVGQTVVDVKRGQAMASNGFLSKRWQVHPDTVRSFLRTLIADGMLVQTTYPKYNLLTICNFDKYQETTDPNTDPNTDPRKEYRWVLFIHFWAI